MVNRRHLLQPKEYEMSGGSIFHETMTSCPQFTSLSISIIWGAGVIVYVIMC